jgi:hypothetical protein
MYFFFLFETDITMYFIMYEPTIDGSALLFLFVASALFYNTVLGITNSSISFLSCLSKFKIITQCWTFFLHAMIFFYNLCFCEEKKWLLISVRAILPRYL